MVGTKYQTISQLREEEFILTHSLEYSPSHGKDMVAETAGYGRAQKLRHAMKTYTPSRGSLFQERFSWEVVANNFNPNI